MASSPQIEKVSRESPPKKFYASLVDRPLAVQGSDLKMVLLSMLAPIGGSSFDAVYIHRGVSFGLDFPDQAVQLDRLNAAAV